jgi:hypothetical protein
VGQDKENSDAQFGVSDIIPWKIRDELDVVEEIVDPEFLVRTALKNFSKPWGSFVRGIVPREVMPDWERL